MENFSDMADRFDIGRRYEALNGCFPNHEARPLVAVTGNFGDKGCELAKGYYYSIEKAGGVPVVVPPTDDGQTILSLLDRVDAVVLSGGGDINPLFLGEQPVPQLGGINGERDAGELLLVRLAYDRQIPVLGICRGAQILAAALGGEVFQDLETQHPAGRNLLKHSQNAERHVPTHVVRLEENSLVKEIFGTSRLYVNSFHHQAVRSAGGRLKASAFAPDGVIEAVESSEYKPLLGVQWHPESSLSAGNDSMQPLFRWLVGEAVSYRAARRFHERNLTLDTHCDTPMFFDKKINFSSRDPHVLVDLHKMTEGGLDAAIMVAYLEQGRRDEASLLAATRNADKILSEIDEMVASAQGVGLACAPCDLYRLKREGKHAVMKGIENGYAVGRDIGNVERFRRRGVVYMTLCHNGDNDICDSASKSENEHNGVSSFGEKVIREMNRVGMMVDLSHGGEKSFYDALDISSQPIVCSHSSSRVLCNHPRNLTDDQLRALARTGGVAQATFYGGFLREAGTASVLDAIEHIEHMVEVVGVEHVGIGSDFDGDGGVPGIASESEMINITRRLMRKKYGEENLALIWGGNFLRVMQQVQDAAAGID